MEIIFNEDIYTAAINIITEKEKQERYIALCVKAEICPVCGKAMNYKTKDNYLTCTVDITHFSKQMYSED